LLRDFASVPAGLDQTISGLEIDSRKVKPGQLFLAWKGVAADGRAFLPQAARAGAVALLYDSDGFIAPALNVPSFPVRALRERAGLIADRFYDHPSKKIIVIGVTGTNGKTTCSQLLAEALDEPGQRAGVIGTLGYGFPERLNPSLHTTPDAVTVHRLLNEFIDDGARYCAMEVSSHALDQGRVMAVSFALALFTNLTRDHLDYHRTMEDYGEAKARLFETEGLRHAVVNVEDAFGRELVAKIRSTPKVNLATYGFETGDFHAKHVRLTRDGIQFIAVTPEGEVSLSSSLLGRFNVLNLLAVLAGLRALGVPVAEAARRLARSSAPRGRAERFEGKPNQPLVIVDYAHTPDALEKMLCSLREHARGKLICVFGCGGNRDSGKRPQMGALAQALADVVVLTDDNPRFESAEAIIDDILAGMTKAPRVERDRRRAIQNAIAEAGANDIVLVAGKGHEDYQEIQGVRHPYSDRQTVRELLGMST
jgi:UDP-N-acetylmuramoyl-L-alanyl-D-glutamate--2,6-diaminopimelate ligase